MLSVKGYSPACFTNSSYCSAVISFLKSPEEEKRFPFARIVEMMGNGLMTWVDTEGKAHGAVSGLSAAILSRSGAEALFKSSPKPLDQVFKDAGAGKVGSFALPTEARLRTASKHKPMSSPNVIGVLRGSDPTLAKESLVFSAHLDHRLVKRGCA